MRQEDHEFETSLDYTAGCWWQLIPVIFAICEAEIGRIKV
jgi:hypothetical protein